MYHGSGIPDVCQTLANPRRYPLVYSTSCRPIKLTIGSEAIDCSPCIHESDVLAKMREGVCEGDRLVLRGAIKLMEQAPEWVWEDAALRCIGDYMDCTFYAGDLASRFTVGFNRKAEVVARCDHPSVWLIVRNYSAIAWAAVGKAVHIVSKTISKPHKKRKKQRSKY
ncbi:uncharacterized protein LOC135466074 [Liolophura sinensis]|uniref:uncharacterized protein LOC135466074 n=1 Tax=Liolophura sinensis TaxID=3198878 RepID=UPI0031582604